MIIIKKSFLNLLIILNNLLINLENVENILYDNNYYYHIIFYVNILNFLYYLIFIN